MEARIQSSRNPIVRRFRRAAAGQPADTMVAEGQRLVAEALADPRLELIDVAWSPRLTARPEGAALLARLASRAAAVHPCADGVLEQLSHLQTHQGISVILRRPRWAAGDLLGDPGAVPLVVAAAGVRDPGNLGAIVRAAEAAGATGLLAADSADPFRDKAVRGSAGSILRLPCLAGVGPADIVGFAREHRLALVAAVGRSATPCWQVDLAVPVLLVLGGEGAGVPDAILAAAAARVGVPLADPVESLNVAVAAGVLLFEARRQRMETRG